MLDPLISGAMAALDDALPLALALFAVLVALILVFAS